jgi:hypothetical protein
LSTRSIFQSSKPVAARNLPGALGESICTWAMLIWLARSEPNHGATRALSTGVRVVTTEITCAPGMSDWLAFSDLLAMSDVPVRVLESDRPAQPASSAPARTMSLDMHTRKSIGKTMAVEGGQAVRCSAALT